MPQIFAIFNRKSVMYLPAPLPPIPLEIVHCTLKLHRSKWLVGLLQHLPRTRERKRLGMIGEPSRNDAICSQNCWRAYASSSLTRASVAASAWLAIPLEIGHCALKLAAQSCWRTYDSSLLLRTRGVAWLPVYLEIVHYCALKLLLSKWLNPRTFKRGRFSMIGDLSRSDALCSQTPPLEVVGGLTTAAPPSNSWA